MKRGRSRRRRRQARLVMYGGTVILLAAVLGTAGLAFGRRSGGRRPESAVEESSKMCIRDSGNSFHGQSNFHAGIHLTHCPLE